jgi:hypothetical protein
MDKERSREAKTIATKLRDEGSTDTAGFGNVENSVQNFPDSEVRPWGWTIWAI